tara:strand:+ start:1504 stop:1710 length:207 start_codon:yes stop_codon:yes gene_type:complete
MRPRKVTNSAPVGPLYAAQRQLVSDLDARATTVGGLVLQGLKTEEDKKQAIEAASEARKLLSSMLITE